MLRFRRGAPARRLAQCLPIFRGPGFARRILAWRWGAVAAATAALGACGGGGQGAGPGPGATAYHAYNAPVAYDLRAGASLPPAFAKAGAAVTRHHLMLQGRERSYTATAGHLLVRSRRTGKVVATMFYVAYTLDGQPAAKRPVTFFWNGGPGSSAVYLELGAWGPRTLRIDEANIPRSALGRPPRFKLGANPDTLLGDTDMVFVDPVGTGLSEAVAPRTNQSFAGVDADAHSVLDFIDAWLHANHREMSPKFVYGESYGGIRTPIVARLMEQQGPLAQGAPVLSGLLMNSPILDFKSNCDTAWGGVGNPVQRGPGHTIAYSIPPVSCEGDIPGYMMVHYAATHPSATVAQASRQAWRAMALVRKTWVPERKVYQATVGSSAFAKAHQPPYVAGDFPSAQQQVFQVMAGATGLRADDWARVFNMDIQDYGSAVLRLDNADWDLESFRLDPYEGSVISPAHASGYEGFNGKPEQPAQAADYFNKAIVSAQRKYFDRFLRYHSVAPYELLNPRQIDYWNWHHDGDLSHMPQTVSDLMEAMDLGGHLPVLIGQGEQDLITPFFQTLLDLHGARLGRRIEFRLYPGGHMLYLTRATHDAFKTTLDHFYARVASGTWSADKPTRIFR